MAEVPLAESAQQLGGLPAGTLIGGYRVEDRIGSGGMAMVYRARDEKLGRAVALKILPLALAADAEFQARFVRESEAASLVDHPNIIPVYGAGRDNGCLYLAMRYVAGGDLHSVVEREGPLAPARVAELLSPVASALDAAHRAGIVHRDVKPANVLVDRSPGRPDHPYLSDFGLAKRDTVHTMTRAGEFIGTASFAAPEQISWDHPATPESDQYALACVAFTLLTGTLPFGFRNPEAVLWAQMSKPPPQVTPRRRDLSVVVDEVLARALAKEPRYRYPSCGEFAGALTWALASPRQAARTPAAAPDVTVSPPRSPAPRPAALAPEPPATRPREARDSAEQTPLPARPPRSRVSALRSAPTGPSAPSERRRRSRRLWVMVIVGTVVVAAAVVAGMVVIRPGAAPVASAERPTLSARLAATFRDPGPGAEGATMVAFGSAGTLSVIDLDGTAFQFSIASGRATVQDVLGQSPDPDAGHLSLNGAVFVNPSLDCATDGSNCLFDVFRYAKGTSGAVLRPVIGSRNGIGTGDDTAAVSAAGIVQVWNLGTMQPTAALKLPPGVTASTAAISPDGGTVAAVAGASGSTRPVYVWNVASRSRTRALAVPGSMGVRATGATGPGIPLAVDGTTLAVSDGQATNVYNIKTGRPMPRVPAGLFALSPDGKTLVTGDPGKDNQALLRDAATGAILATVTVPSGEIMQTFAFSPDGKSLAAGCSFGNYVWRLSPGAPAKP